MIWIKILLIILAVALMAVFVQVSLYHYKGRFRHWIMWFPVLIAPFFAVLFFLSAFSKDIALFTLSFSVVPIIGGIIGFVAHLKGIRQMVGGMNLDNVLLGPPIMLPLTISVLPIIGDAAIIIMRMYEK